MPKFGSAQAAAAAAAQRIRCRLSVDFVLTGDVNTDVAWDVEDFKFGITHSVALNSDQIVIVTAGIYLVTFTATFNMSDVPSSTGPMEASITVGGVDQFGSSTFRPELTGAWPFDDNTVATLVATSILSLAAGAIVRSSVLAPAQATGAPVLRRDGVSGPGNGATHIDIHRLS